MSRGPVLKLKIDYEDVLRINDLRPWHKDDPRILAIRKLAYLENRTYATYLSHVSNIENACNCLLTLINQANYLLDKQLAVLKDQLTKEGDVPEMMRAVRKEQIKKKIFGGDDDFDAYLREQ